MRVLELALYSPDFLGGFGDSLLALGAELKRYGDKLVVCFPQRRRWMDVFEEHGFPVEILPIHGIFDFRALLQLCKLLKKYKIDIIHTHFGLETQVIASLAKLVTSYGIKVVWHWRNPPRTDICRETKVKERSGMDECGSKGVRLRIKRRLGNPLYRLLDKLCVSVHVVVSEEIYNILLARGIDREKIKLVYNGIDVAKYNITNEEIRVPNIKPQNSCLIGSIANFRAQKDHRTFLAAAKLVIEKYPEVKFLLVGDGPTKSLIEDYGKELGISSSLIFVGSQPDVRGFIKACDFTVLSSWYEGFPNVTCESMALERPVIGTRVGGIPTIVRDNETGFLVPLSAPESMAERMLYLIEHPDERERLGKNGRKLVAEKFTTSRWAKQMRTLFLKCLNSI